MNIFWRIVATAALAIVALYGSAITQSALRHGARLIWLLPAAVGLTAIGAIILFWLAERSR